MKKLYFIIVFSIVFKSLSSQVILNSTTHSSQVGDKINFIEIKPVDAGKEGKNIIWDFSKIQVTNKTKSSTFIEINNTAQTSFTFKPNIAFIENNRTNYIFTNNDSYNIVGFIENDLILNYQKPIERLKFPLKYGDKFRNDVKGIANYTNNGHFVDIHGFNEVEADAYGVMILPDNKFINVLRVKQYTSTTQISICDIVEVEAYRYTWYCSSVKHPLLVINHQTHKFSNGNITIISETHLNEIVFNSNFGQSQNISNQEISNFNYNVFPNPFIDQQNITYILDNKATISIELYDILGKKISTLIAEEKQERGIYSLILDAEKLSLNTGIYFLKFYINDKVVIEKISKTY